MTHENKAQPRTRYSSTTQPAPTQVGSTTVNSHEPKSNPGVYWIGNDRAAAVAVSVANAARNMGVNDAAFLCLPRTTPGTLFCFAKLQLLKTPLPAGAYLSKTPTQTRMRVLDGVTCGQFPKSFRVLVHMAVCNAASISCALLLAHACSIVRKDCITSTCWTLKKRCALGERRLLLAVAMVS